MVTKLFVPQRKIIVPRVDSHIVLDMAFDGASDSYLFDKSRYRSHGAISGAAWATGLHGKALDFDPTIPSYVEIPSAYTQLNFISEKFSIIMRVKIDDLTTYRVLFCRGEFNADGYEFFIHPSGFLYFRTYQSGVNQATRTDTGIIIGTRYTVGFSRDSADAVIYVNGVNKNYSAGTHINPTTSIRSARIGIRDNESSYPIDGEVEFIRIFKGIALSASEHLAYHNALS